MSDICYADRILSPLGELFAVAKASGQLVRLDFVGSKDRAREPAELEPLVGAVELHWNRSALGRVREALEAYFAGELREFRLPLAPRGTDFQLRVWSALQRIPHGTTISYARLAARVGCPRAPRAVGRANATNPISIVVPCHRVVGSDGSLTGYAGGLARKRALLELEGCLARA